MIYKIKALGCAIDYRVHNHNITNLERALKERVFMVKTSDGFAPPPRPESQAFFDNTMLKYRRALVRLLPRPARMELLDFPEKYTGRKRAVYLTAAKSLLTTPVVKRDAMITAFVKAEKVNVTAKVDPAPRVIQPRTPRYNVSLGCYIKPIEKRIYKAINDVFGGITVAKGLNARERGRAIHEAWESFHRPVAIGLDASRFDQHVSSIALRWEHGIYMSCFPGDKELRKLLNWQVCNIGRGYTPDGRVKYKTDGCRMSGDMTTALGNVLLMTGMIYSYMDHCGVARYRLINDGDDCVVIIEQPQLAKFTNGLTEWFTTLGFTMKVEEPVYTIEGIEFCQARPVFDGKEYIMVRDIHSALQKDCCSIKPLDNPKVMKKWLMAVGEGGLSLTGGIPMWQDFYNALHRAGVNIDVAVNSKNILNDPTFETGLRMLAARMNRRYSTVHPRARYSFWLAFGITPDEQIVMERYYASRLADPVWEKPSYDWYDPLPFFPMRKPC